MGFKHVDGLMAIPRQSLAGLTLFLAHLPGFFSPIGSLYNECLAGRSAEPA